VFKKIQVCFRFFLHVSYNVDCESTWLVSRGPRVAGLSRVAGNGSRLGVHWRWRHTLTYFTNLFDWSLTRICSEETYGSSPVGQHRYRRRSQRLSDVSWDVTYVCYEGTCGCHATCHLFCRLWLFYILPFAVGCSNLEWRDPPGDFHTRPPPSASQSSTRSDWSTMQWLWGENLCFSGDYEVHFWTNQMIFMSKIILKQLFTSGLVNIYWLFHGFLWNTSGYFTKKWYSLVYNEPLGDIILYILHQQLKFTTFWLANTNYEIPLCIS